LKNRRKVKKIWESFVEGVVCPLKIREVLICNLIKIPPIFYWAQAAPTRYRDRSH